MSHPVAVTPDRHLLQRVSRGDAAAGEVLRQRHAGSVYALAYAVLLDPGEAEVVENETFAYASRAARWFDPAGQSVFGWLTAFARSRAEERRDRTGQKPRSSRDDRWLVIGSVPTARRLVAS